MALVSVVNSQQSQGFILELCVFAG